MATRSDVKRYLAYWFQIGKKVVAENGAAIVQPKTVLNGDRFSPEFEACWSKILEAEGKGYHLESTDQSLAELLSPDWDITSCARCDMPIPIREIGVELHPCPCNDLPDWPNEEIPKPHLPVDSQQRLANIKERVSVRRDR